MCYEGEEDEEEGGVGKKGVVVMGFGNGVTKAFEYHRGFYGNVGCVHHGQLIKNVSSDEKKNVDMTSSRDSAKPAIVAC